MFPGLVRWSQTAWFLAELFLRIRARAVSRDNLPAATFPEPATRPKSFFQSKTYFSTAPIIVLACTCRVLTCSSGSGRKKTWKNLALFFGSALCISLNWWRRSKCLWLSFERFLYMQTTLEIKQTETMIGIALKKKATMGKLQLGDKIWNFSFFSEFMTIFRENVTFTF